MIGFDIGGTKCAVCYGVEKDGNLEVIEKKAFPTEKTMTPYEIIDKMCDLAKEMCDNIDAVGISCGGPLDAKKGIIMSPPNLPGWDNVHITDIVEEKLGCKAKLCNDADACGLAEYRYGAGKGSENMVFFTFGTGLGAGIILGGKVYSGSNSLAGEAGHIRLSPNGPVGYGKEGSFEGFCSGAGIAQIGRVVALEKFGRGEKPSFCEDVTKLDTINAKSVSIFADEGHEDAIEVYRRSAEKLGFGLSIVIDILDPDTIVIGSIFQRSEELFREPMTKVLEKECLKFKERNIKIVPALLGNNLGDFAALSVAAMVLSEQ